MDAEKLQALFNERKANHSINFELKDEQIKVALAVLNGKNVIGLLPTGFGKTFCMVLPILAQTVSNSISIIISPLSSLIDDQMRSLERWNFRCAKITALTDMDSQIVSGNLLLNLPYLKDYFTI